MMIAAMFLAMVTVWLVWPQRRGVMFRRVWVSGWWQKGLEWWRGRRLPHRELQRELPVVWELLAGCVEAGMPLRRATAVVADAVGGGVADELRRVLRAVEVGTPEAQAWREATILGAAARDVARSVNSGASLVVLLRRHAADARADHNARMLVSAKEIGVRAIMPMVVCFLPAFLLVGVVPVVAGTVMEFFG